MKSSSFISLFFQYWQLLVSTFWNCQGQALKYMYVKKGKTKQGFWLTMGLLVSNHSLTTWNVQKENQQQNAQLLPLYFIAYSYLYTNGLVLFRSGKTGIPHCLDQRFFTQFGLHLSAVIKELNNRVLTNLRNIMKLVDEIWNSFWHSSCPEAVFFFLISEHTCL